MSAGPQAGDWDAGAYDRLSHPQALWASEQLRRLTLRGDEVALDAGCGSGRVTAELARLLPRGRVYAVDVAPSMVAHARRALGEGAIVLRQDLVELSLPEPVELVFSNATFHWIADHDALFDALARNMRPGARLVAQCGGAGNIDALRRLADEIAGQRPFAPYFEGWRGPWNYAGAQETADRLARAGFTDVRAWLEQRPTPLSDPRPFVCKICLLRHLERLPGALREPFVDAVLERSASPFVLEYVRLNMTARRGDDP